MLNKINDFFSKYAGITRLLIAVVVGAAGLFLNNTYTKITEGVNTVLVSINEIRKNTSTLASRLDKNLDGGVTVIVGVNPVEIKENIAFIYDDNDNNLKIGDVIYLQNFTENTFQATLRFIVSKSFPPGSKNSEASIFISDEAAKKIGFSDYKKKGTIKLKLNRVLQKDNNS